MKRLPVRIKIIKGESLLSFLIRVSKVNGMTLLHLMNITKESVNHLIDKYRISAIDYAPIKILNFEKLEYISGNNYVNLLESTLYYLLYRFCDSSSVERSRFLTNMLNTTFCYCPLCLQYSGHHRLLWNFRLISICTIHNIPLLKKCSACNNEILKFKMLDIYICPYCGHDLRKYYEVQITSSIDLEFQRWLYMNLSELVKVTENKIEAKNAAIKLLLILNDQKSVFNQELIENKNINSNQLSILKQIAKGTVGEKKAVHFSYLLPTLYSHNLDIHGFLNLKVNDAFMKSLVKSRKLKCEDIACKAPWCKNYNVKGQLVQTGTHSYINKNNIRNMYYLACTKCGCRYAFDSDNNFVNRDYFIEVYNNIIKLDYSDMSLISISKTISITKSKLLNCFAYYSTRNIEFDMPFMKDYSIDIKLLEKFIKAIKTNQKLGDIKKWICWKNYKHYLTHRYHIRVMNAILEFGRKRSKKIDTLYEKKQHVINILEEMLNNDENINLQNVSNNVGVSRITLWEWGCSDIIKEMKLKQKLQRKPHIVKKEYLRINNYIEEHNDVIINIRNMYNYLNTNREALKKISPELTSFIHNSVISHNNEIRSNYIH